ncbi:MAG TPA: hypothetical protein ENI23_09270, partial [bacterium]|nr:hypothetical protein [bacterium]
MATRAKKRKEERRVSAQRRVETHKSGFERTTVTVSDDVQFFSLGKEGTKRIDIIPYTVGEGNPFADLGELHFERTFWTHRDIGAEQNSYVCPAKTAKKKCPICEYRSSLQRDPNSDSELIKSLVPKERQLWNVIDLEESEKGVQLWEISFHLFGKRLDSEIENADEDDDYKYFADLKDGRTLKLGVVQKSIKGGKPFCDVDTIGFKTRREDYNESILEDVHNLDEILNILDYDKLKDIFLQVDSDSEEKNKEERTKKPTKKKTEEKPDEEDDNPAKKAGLKEGMSVEHDDHG